MTWYSLNLAGDFRTIDVGAWQLAWQVSTEMAPRDPGNAIFKKVGPGNQLILYFTPSSHVLAESFGARPCPQPSPAGLSLVAGSERARQLHFGRVFALRRGLHAFRNWVPQAR